MRGRGCSGLPLSRALLASHFVRLLLPLAPDRVKEAEHEKENTEEAANAQASEKREKKRILWLMDIAWVSLPHAHGVCVCVRVCHLFEVTDEQAENQRRKKRKQTKTSVEAEESRSACLPEVAITSTHTPVFGTLEQPCPPPTCVAPFRPSQGTRGACA